MPIEQTTGPDLVEVAGIADKAVSTGYLRIEISITGGASGFPPDEELDPILLGLFNAVGYEGWVGTVSKRYVSTNTIAPNPTEPTP